MNSKLLKQLGLFILAFFIMQGLSQLRAGNDEDKYYCKTKLARGQEVTCVVDLGTQSPLKYLLQPNVYTIGLRLEPQEKDIELTCTAEGLEHILSQSSKKGRWRSLQPQEPLFYRRNYIPISLELSFPRSKLNQPNIEKGRIILRDKRGVYGIINLELVNSRYR